MSENDVTAMQKMRNAGMMIRVLDISAVDVLLSVNYVAFVVDV